QASEDEGPAVALGLGDVAGGGDELGKALVADRAGVDREGLEDDLADRTLAVLRIALAVVGPHQEGASLELDHPRHRAQAISAAASAVHSARGRPSVPTGCRATWSAPASRWARAAAASCSAEPCGTTASIIRSEPPSS